MSYNVIPTGLVLPFAGKKDKVPNGWLLCDGSTKLRSDFPHLFEVIGTSHGAGDGSTTFHLPDYRGRVLRGVDDGAGRDDSALTRTSANAGGEVGDEVGSVQDDQIQGHHHDVGPYNNTTGAGVGTSIPKWSALETPTTSSTALASTVRNDGVNGNPRTGFETRMKNANVNYIVKV